MQKITIIIPCYNEETRLNAEAYLKYSEENPEAAFLFVNDGSRDRTLEILKDMSKNSSSIRYLDVKKNSGKAEAVRMGIMHAVQLENAPPLVGFYDADMATPFSDMMKMTDFIFEKDIYMAAGCRFKRMGGNMERRYMRFLFGRVFATCAANILKLPVYDTQCGAKIIQSKVAVNIFDQPFVSKWLFDVELFARIIVRYSYIDALSKIIEFPLSSWKDIKGSKLGIKEIIRQPYNLIKIRNHYKLKKYAQQKGN